jgi:hypothetical protein
MQVFVKSLAQGADTPVFASYEDNVNIPKEAHPPGATLLRNISSKYVVGIPPRLLSSWRENIASIVEAEAAYRIEAVFPAAMQSTASLAKHFGQELDEKEIMRGLNYISAVRAAAQAIIAKAPDNPGDDVNWPAVVEPVKL